MLAVMYTDLRDSQKCGFPMSFQLNDNKMNNKFLKMDHNGVLSLTCKT